jgi:hypothetical protein
MAHPLKTEPLRDGDRQRSGIVTYALAVAATPPSLRPGRPRAASASPGRRSPPARIWIDFLVRDWFYLLPLFAAAHRSWRLAAWCKR